MSTRDFLPSTTYQTIVCCTASRRVFGAEMTDGGYIQGAGDDSEGWSKGLTPTLFWRHSEQLLSAVEEDIPDLVHGLISTGSDNGDPSGDAVKIGPTSLYIGTLSSTLQAEHYDGSIICDGIAPSKPDEDNKQHEGKRVLNLSCGEGKLGSRALRAQLPRIPPFIASLLPNLGPAPKILLSCPTGKDLSVGTALAVLCLFFHIDNDNCNALLLSPLPSTSFIHTYPSFALELTFRFRRPFQLLCGQ